MSNEDEVEAVFAAIPEPMKTTAAMARALVKKVAPDLVEKLKWGHPTYLGKHSVVYIAAFKNHVNLGFIRGGDLLDNAGLLEGTGKGLRHVKLKTPAAVRAKGRILSRLIRIAAELDAGTIAAADLRRP
jgi:hypothetical protein